MVRLLLRFSEKVVNKPITSQVIIEQGVLLNILSSRINQRGGEILVEVSSDNADEVIKAFREKGVEVTISRLVQVDSERCFACGACYSLCPVGAIAIKEDFSVVFNEEECVGGTCGLCVDACPARAIKLIK